MFNPVVLQESWIADVVLQAVTMNSYSNPLVAKDITKHARKTPILKIDKFLKQTPDNDLAAVVSDATHKIFASFPFATIMRFENENRRRLTNHSVHNLILIEKAKLVFYEPRRAQKMFGSFPASKLDQVVLEIDSFEFFLRDNNWIASVENELRLVYEEDWYLKLCGAKKDTSKFFDGEEFDSEDYT